MAILKVVEYGDDVLRKPTQEVHKVSAKIQTIVSDMFDTMYASFGVGLAAPQVGVSKRIFTIDCTTETEKCPPLVFINPVIIKKEGAMVSLEGCLSFPNVYIDVRRYASITIKAKDIKGRTFTLTPEPKSLLCRAIQHEFDHLNGVLFIDHVIDRFGTDEILKTNKLPLIDPQMLLDEPDLEKQIILGMEDTSKLKESKSDETKPKTFKIKK